MYSDAEYINIVSLLLPTRAEASRSGGCDFFSSPLIARCVDMFRVHICTVVIHVLNFLLVVFGNI